MGKKRIDWEKILRAWIAAKGTNSSLTKSQFFKDQGVARRSALKKIGVRMDALWAQTVAVAQNKLTKDTGFNLAKDFKEMIRGGRAVFDTGQAALAGPAAIPPADATEAAQMMKAGLAAIIEPVKLMTGGEPFMKEAERKPIFDWTPSEKELRQAKRKKKTRR